MMTFFLRLMPAMLLCSCDNSEPALRTGIANWQPKSIGGPLAIRALPASSNLMADYEGWRQSETQKVARVYKASISASNQLAFTAELLSGDTPMGYTEETLVTFLYSHPELGNYEVLWRRRGKHRTDFLRVSEPTVIWLRPLDQTNSGGLPRLRLVAVQGIESDRAVAAE